MSAAWEAAIKRAEELGRAQRERSIDMVATLMVRQPRRILAALFPFGKWAWPHPTYTLVELLTLARSILRNEPNYIGIDLVECAEEALIRIIAAPIAIAEEAARCVA